MEDRSKMIYGNEIGRKAYRNAIHSKKKFIKKYGDDTGTKYPVRLRKNAVLGDTLGIVDVRVAKKHGTAGEKNQTIPFDTEKGIIGKYPHGLRSLPHFHGDCFGGTCNGLCTVLDGFEFL